MIYNVRRTGPQMPQRIIYGRANFLPWPASLSAAAPEGPLPLSQIHGAARARHIKAVWSLGHTLVGNRSLARRKPVGNSGNHAEPPHKKSLTARSSSSILLTCAWKGLRCL